MALTHGNAGKFDHSLTALDNALLRVHSWTIPTGFDVEDTTPTNVDYPEVTPAGLRQPIEAVVEVTVDEAVGVPPPSRTSGTLTLQANKDDTANNKIVGTAYYVGAVWRGSSQGGRAQRWQLRFVFTGSVVWTDGAGAATTM